MPIRYLVGLLGSLMWFGFRIKDENISLVIGFCVCDETIKNLVACGKFIQGP